MDKLIAAMKIVLGTTFAVYLKMHAAHWNVEGAHFSAYHTMFAMMYQEIWQAIDPIAEQIRQLDAYAPASLERLAELSRVKSSNEIMPPVDGEGYRDIDRHSDRDPASRRSGRQTRSGQLLGRAHRNAQQVSLAATRYRQTYLVQRRAPPRIVAIGIGFEL